MFQGRDTSSRLNYWAGGRVFPGVHHLADFKVNEHDGQYNVKFKSGDDTFLEIAARETTGWNEQSVFENLHCASDFFKQGSVGYSPNKISEAYEGLELKTTNWEVSPLTVSEVKSSFFEDGSIFPKGTIKFDNALLMRNIDHEWNSKKNIRRK